MSSNIIAEKINHDWKEALKAKDNFKKNVLTYIKSEIKTAAINQRVPENEIPDVLAAKVLNKLAKQRKEMMLALKHRPDLKEKETAELDIITHYLSQSASFSRAELEKVIDNIIADTKEADIGKVMRQLMSSFRDKISDGKEAQEIVKSKLGS